MSAKVTPIESRAAPTELLRRHLATFRLGQVAHRFTDVVVLGSGVAGLSAAAAASRIGNTEVLLVAKSELCETATQYAQGGVAAVLEGERMADSIEMHVQDTVAAGGGLVDEDAARVTAAEASARVNELTDRGADWDRDSGGALHYTLEGGHSRPRIVHFGDSTGVEMQRVLTNAARNLSCLSVLEHTFAIDFLTTAGEVHGVLVRRPHGDLEAIWAKTTLLVTGGLGRLYRETTNPAVATGDGIAMAFRAGAVLQDLEFVQFHPTTLYLAGADRFLITEAVRGEGGVLVTAAGERFMPRFHPRAELAPRDVVARAIVTVMRETGENKVFLDLSPISPSRIRERFPRILSKLRRFGIDILKEPIPVRPSAHYSIGGIRTDLHGRTSLEHLFAAGEVASTGLHGANRLASNSLLEGLVFGHRAGEAAALEARQRPQPTPRPMFEETPSVSTTTPPLDLEDLTSSLRSLVWQDVGLERDGGRMMKALQQIETWIPYVLARAQDTPQGWTLQNMLTIAYLLTRCALRREESRGVHYREDFPERDDQRYGRHLTISRDDLLAGKVIRSAGQDESAPSATPNEDARS